MNSKALHMDFLSQSLLPPEATSGWNEYRRKQLPGGIDLANLETLLQRPEYRGRTLIGSFSAASNVTGRRSPVHELAALMHRYGGMACFDYAACAPYVDIDMTPADATPENDTTLDAVFLSPHKFLGGSQRVSNPHGSKAKIRQNTGGFNCHNDFVFDVKNREIRKHHRQHPYLFCQGLRREQ